MSFPRARKIPKPVCDTWEEKRQNSPTGRPYMIQLIIRNRASKMASETVSVVAAEGVRKRPNEIPKRIQKKTVGRFLPCITASKGLVGTIILTKPNKPGLVEEGFATDAGSFCAKTF